MSELREIAQGIAHAAGGIIGVIALNVPTAGKVHPFMAVALVNYFVTRDRTIPLNAGVLKPVRMTLPEGSVVNPKFPAACGVRYATVLRIYDQVRARPLFVVDRVVGANTRLMEPQRAQRAQREG